MAPPPIRQGHFYWVDDEAIFFPEEPEREPHPTRGCIVIEGDESLRHGAARVLVVPTSTDVARKDVYDVIIPSPPMPRAECVALVGHVQPILRSDLRNLVQPLPGEWVDRVLAAMVGVLGLPIEEEEEPPF